MGVEEVVAFLEKTDFGKKDWCFFVQKHDGAEYIQHNKKDGTFEAYVKGSDEMVDTGTWRVDGSAYIENDDGEFKGPFELLGHGDFIIHFNAGKHGYHQYRLAKEEYARGRKAGGVY